MIHRKFHFKGLEPEADLARYANQALNELLDASPHESTAIALLESASEGYIATIDIYSRYGPFISRGTATCPTEAVRGAVEAMSEKLARWQEQQVDSGNARLVRGPSGRRPAQNA